MTSNLSIDESVKELMRISKLIESNDLERIGITSIGVEKQRETFYGVKVITNFKVCTIEYNILNRKYTMGFKTYKNCDIPEFERLQALDILEILNS